MTDPFEDALAAATEEWMGKGGVVAVGEGADAGEPTIEVWATNVASGPDVPDTFRGYPVRVHDTGGPVQVEDSDRR